MWKGPHDHERTFIGRPTICTPFALVFTNRDRFPPVAYPLDAASLRLASVAYELHSLRSFDKRMTGGPPTFGVTDVTSPSRH